MCTILTVRLTAIKRIQYSLFQLVFFFLILNNRGNNVGAGVKINTLYIIYTRIYSVR